MANYGLSSVIFALIFSGLFVFAIINVGVILASDNNPEKSISSDNEINNRFNALKGNLSKTQQASNSTSEAISKTPVTISDQNIVLDAITGAWKSLTKMPIQIYNTFSLLIATKLTGGTDFYIVLGSIAGILVMVIVFGAWKFIQTGEY